MIKNLIFIDILVKFKLRSIFNVTISLVLGKKVSFFKLCVSLSLKTTTIEKKTICGIDSIRKEIDYYPIFVIKFTFMYTSIRISLL